MTNSTPSPIDFNAIMTRSRYMTALRAELDALTNHTPDCDLSDPYRPYDDHDRAHIALRDILIDDTYEFDTDDDDLPPTETIERIRFIIRELRTDEYSIDYLSHRALDQSLCPMHYCDYAACFDDDDPECATIRAIFPSHDT